jgi:hypothetical protein
MYNQLKPRFNRSEPKVLRAADLKGKHYSGTNGGYRATAGHGSLAPSKATQWRPVSMDTLGYLAATGKVDIVTVHQRIDGWGDKVRRQFKKSFFENVNLEKPSQKEMDQINLFSHLLF